MRSIFNRIAVVANVLFLGACTMADIKANEDKARAILSAINNGARMAASVVREGIDAVCANAPAVASGAVVIRAGLQTQAGPNTTQNLDNLDKSLLALNAACTRAAADPNAPDIKVLLQTAWSAYLSAKAAQNKAIAAGG